MKARFVLLLGLVMAINCKGSDMTTPQIKDFIRNVDRGLPRGKIYDIDYTVQRTRTDFFYDRRRQLIQVMEAHRADGVKNIASAGSDGKAVAPEEAFAGLIGAFRRELKLSPKSECSTRYSADGVGFYVKQVRSWPDAQNPKVQDGPTIYVSDGKIMGTFYKDAQAALQPATERPQMPEDYWSDLAYSLGAEKFSEIADEMSDLAMKSENNEIVISGEMPQEASGRTLMELHLDAPTLAPLRMTISNFDRYGKLSRKSTKTWEYGSFSGLQLPQKVVDQIFETDPAGKTDLAQEQTFTINSFSPTPVNPKAELDALLKSNYSVYDEITGAHYLSGNAGDMLDKLSK